MRASNSVAVCGLLSLALVLGCGGDAKEAPAAGPRDDSSDAGIDMSTGGEPGDPTGGRNAGTAGASDAGHSVGSTGGATGSDSTGSDTGDDAGGMSDAGQSQTSERVCFGDYEIRTSTDLALIADCTVITGDLDVSETAFDELSLPRLTRVGGSLEIYKNASLTSVRLPVLATVGGLVVGDYYRDYPSMLVSLSLPVLTTAGQLSVRYSALTSLGLPALTTVDSLGISDNKTLRSLNLPALTTVRSLGISNNDALTSLSLPMLTEGNIIVHNNDALTSLGMPGRRYTYESTRLNFKAAFPVRK